jgi:hypothetical protein
MSRQLLRLYQHSILDFNDTRWPHDGIQRHLMNVYPIAKKMAGGHQCVYRGVRLCLAGPWKPDGPYLDDRSSQCVAEGGH